MILLRCPQTGQYVLVASADGYEGWEVVANPCMTPGPHDYWCSDNQSWKPIEGAEARAQLLAIVRNPETLADMLADILARLPAIEE